MAPHTLTRSRATLFIPGGHLVISLSNLATILWWRVTPCTQDYRPRAGDKKYFINVETFIKSFFFFSEIGMKGLAACRRFKIIHSNV